MIKRGARTQDTATAFAGYGTGNRTPALVRYKNESINRLVTTPQPFYWFLSGIAGGNGIISALPALATCEAYSASTDEKKYKGGKSQPKTCR